MSEESPEKADESKRDKEPEELEILEEELDLSPEEAKELIREVRLSEFFSGPLPPPKLMKGYDEIIPNGAERLLSLFEKQADIEWIWKALSLVPTLGALTVACGWDILSPY